MAVAVPGCYVCIECGFESDDQADFKHGPGGSFCGALVPKDGDLSGAHVAEISERASASAARETEAVLRRAWKARYGAAPLDAKFTTSRHGDGFVIVTLRGKLRRD